MKTKPVVNKVIYVYFFLAVVILVGGTITLIEFFKGSFRAMNNWKDANEEDRQRLRYLVAYIIGGLLGSILAYFILKSNYTIF